MDSDEGFSFSSTAHNFDEHIGKSIRGYDDLRSDIKWGVNDDR
jgi:hypothetical protein